MGAQVVDGAGGTDRPPPLDRIAGAAAGRGSDPNTELVVERLRRWWPEAEAALRRVYGAAVDDLADRLGATLLQLVADPQPQLRRLDSPDREAVPDWFQQPGIVAATSATPTASPATYTASPGASTTSPSSASPTST